MNRLILVVAGCALFLAGCKDHAAEARLAQAQRELDQLQLESVKQQVELGAVDAQLERARKEARDAATQLSELQRREDSGPAESRAEEITALEAKVRDLEAQVARLQEELVVARAAQPAPAAKQPAEQPIERPVPTEANRKAEDLLARVKANPANEDLFEEMADALEKADNATRLNAVDELKALVAAEPRNKDARMALATALATRFRDLLNPMDQGKLAADIKVELDKALEIDPEYYYAQHFMAVMKVNYPPFTDEFKTADKDLDKTLELQAKMPWEKDFAEVYAAYSKWYRAQGKLEEAAAKVQAGLDKEPRDEGLLAEKKKVDEARAAKDAPKEGS